MLYVGTVTLQYFGVLYQEIFPEKLCYNLGQE